MLQPFSYGTLSYIFNNVGLTHSWYTKCNYYEKGIFNSHNNSNGSWKFLNKNYFNGFNVVKSCRCCLLLWTIKVQRREYFCVLDDINVTSHTLTSESSSAPKNCFKTHISLIRYQICLYKTTFCKRAAQRKIYQTNFRRVPWIRVSTHAFFVGFWIREFLGTKRTWNNSREVTKHAQFECNPKHVIIELSNSFRIQTFFMKKDI